MHLCSAQNARNAIFESIQSGFGMFRLGGVSFLSIVISCNPDAQFLWELPCYTESSRSAQVAVENYRPDWQA